MFVGMLQACNAVLDGKKWRSVWVTTIFSEIKLIACLNDVVDSTFHAMRQ
jgi:hypothetical protein